MTDDPTLLSVAAYTRHTLSYMAANSAKMEGELLRFAKLLPRGGGTVLDAGCAGGRDLIRLARLGCQVVGVDLNGAFVKMARTATTGLDVVVLHEDLRYMSLSDASVDGVWACASIVHLPAEEAQLALAEFARVSRPGAPLHLSVKLKGGWKESPFGRRWYESWDPDRLTRLCEEAGFRVDSVDVGDVFIDLWGVR